MVIEKVKVATRKTIDFLQGILHPLGVKRLASLIERFLVTKVTYEGAPSRETTIEFGTR